MDSPETEKSVNYPALIAGPVLAAFLYWLLPDSYTALDGSEASLLPAMKAVISMIVWMVVWWFSEAVDIAVTAMLPLALFPLLGIADIKTTAASYASDLIFLFAGGFILGLSLSRWHLDKRIALLVLLSTGERPANIVAGFMLVAAFLSAFVSNTATTIMLFPIAMSVLSRRAAAPSHDGNTYDVRSDNFVVCLMIAIAYAANLGGMSTLVGTAPNAFTATFIQNSLPPHSSTEISFVSWTKMALPVNLTLLLVCWLLLTHFIFPLRQQLPGIERDTLKEHYRMLGPMSKGEWASLIVFALTATLWITRPAIAAFSIEIDGNLYLPFKGLSDASIAIFAALLLFTLPVGDGRAAMDWPTAVRLPWGILILLGGGLALAKAVKDHGIDQLLGAQISSFAHLPDWAILLLAITLVVFLTEITSNTATTAVLVPMFAAFAPVLDIPPLLLLIPVTFAASCAFMMPVATPPNAIVFGSGFIHVSQMIKSGFWMNLIAIALITTISYFWLT